MRAIIIAAGKGTRLYPLTKNTPKSLIEISDGLTLLESQLYSLKENDIKDVTIIVGYRAEQIEAKIKKYQSDFNINTVYNPFYDSSNNLISVWMARHFMQDDFITINGDDIFNASVIENLLKSEHSITMVTDEKSEYDDDDMKIIHKNGQVLKVSKQISLAEANGESVGIIKFSGYGPKIYVNTLEEMVRDEDNKNAFYLKAIQEIINKGYPVHFSKCEESDWGELDFHPDLVFIRDYMKKSNFVEKIFTPKK
ncbi:MAG: phosphocholine cytidylyltransferase family protein [Candidatus Delongbacteria bacterium]|nr:phosphocholine cytidylyltransferase family protein [Candidatus Delongbacteria bacterium]MBN2835379.1 phosphocholine cytidylyltransferase family protein [Candidatus Delongbacteria bacterium]